MSERDQRGADDLARFLATGAPADASALDDDVREALFAIRPDLAPAPRVSADDILASVRRGPLVDTSIDATPAGVRSHEGAEVVQFPGAEDEEPSFESVEATVPSSPPQPAPRRRWAWIGGASGAGLFLAAAATLFLVSRPALEEAVQEAAAPAAPAAAIRSEAGEERAVPEREPLPLQAESGPDRNRSAAQSGSKKADVPRQTAKDKVAAYRPVEKPKRVTEGPTPSVPSSQGVDVDSLSTRSVPPTTVGRGYGAGEAKENVASRGVGRRATGRLDRYDLVADETEGDLEIPEVAEGNYAETANTAAPDLDQLRTAARPADLAPGAWRQNLTTERLAVLDEALDAANVARESGDPALAAELLGQLATKPPSAVAQHFAALATADFLAAQQPGRAIAVARQGLAQGSANTPGRSRLLYLLGLALEAQGASGTAADAFEEARAANEDRR